ncbi:MAG: hypothetical protein RQ966_10760 [Acetobacteraceae bacterium]|nr:hypothetical protein [Acetobacteraceae bacterium]
MWKRIEDVPKPLLCVPLVAQWLWLTLRYGSATLPSAVNPGISCGGLVGESKAACLEQIGARFADAVAPWRLVEPGDDPVRVRHSLACPYPLIAKPDVGWCGFGVRRIENDSELLAYAEAFPQQSPFILQRLVEAPLEAGLFYSRDCEAGTGRLLSVTIRHTPSVLGDGQRETRALIGADRRLRRHAAAFAASLRQEQLERVPEPGEKLVLTTVASLRVGACYEDVSWCITETLQAKVDAIARSMDRFHWGPFDVRFASLKALRAGDFEIIEVNGAGSEAINFWDPSIPLLASFRVVFAKQVQLFRLGAAMRRSGHLPVGVLGLAQAWLRQRRLIAAYPV